MSAGHIEIDDDDACVAYRFLAKESDPHRVRFWHLTIDTEQLTLQAVEEPDAELTFVGAPWHELHDLLTVRPQLLEEIEGLQQEITNLEHDIARLRAKHRRLQRVCETREERLGRRPVLQLSSRRPEQPS